MPPSKLMSITGAKQGAFKGDSNGKIGIVAFSHDIDAPRDAATGAASGKRQHKPLTIVKSIDSSTPQILQAIASNETLTSVVISFLKPGSSEEYYVITLENATISAVHEVKQTLSGDSGSLKFSEYEEVSFTYEKITWEHKEGKTSATDNWSTQE